MNLSSVSVWKAGNGIFIEYFWEYLWGMCGYNKCLCSTVAQFLLPYVASPNSVSQSRCFSHTASLSLCLIVYTVPFCFSLCLPFQQPQNPRLVRTSI